MMSESERADLLEELEDLKHRLLRLRMRGTPKQRA